MSDTLIPSIDVLRRTLAADISYTISRMKVLEGIPGNPIGIAYRWFDESAVALMARLPAFCRVVGRKGRIIKEQPSDRHDISSFPSSTFVAAHFFGCERRDSRRAWRALEIALLTSTEASSSPVSDLYTSLS